MYYQLGAHTSIVDKLYYLLVLAWVSEDFYIIFVLLFETGDCKIDFYKNKINQRKQFEKCG